MASVLSAFGWAFLFVAVGQPRLVEESASRQVLELNQGWEFRVDSPTEGSWAPARVPAAFEEMAGIEFDGVGLYRLRMPRPALAEGQRAYLRFEAAATEAVVSCDGDEVGRHLGGWTPFRCDISEALRSKPAGELVEILVRLDEKVGHNTQGFLPIIQPHFGGIWQRVSLEIAPETHFDDLQVLCVGDLDTKTMRVEAPVIGADSGRVAAAYRVVGGEWSKEFETQVVDGMVRLELPIAEARPWSPTDPVLYEVRLRHLGSGDAVIMRGAFRRIETVGHGLRLNGDPLQVRGVLNWGYYPPNLAPSPNEDRFRRDVAYARTCGFNLMKFCLWVPPRRYLEICDEEGMLAWVEYPTWHPKLDAAHRDELEAEFEEFFAFDRNHPCVILRSLTCETGTSSDLDVIQSLYDRCKAMIPEAIVEDDSSWIEWQRVFDFYDDHPYGNNASWVATLDRLRRYIAEREAKPLVLGEAIAADTWPELDLLSVQVGETRPYWLPGFFDACLAWRKHMESLYGPAGLDALIPDSKSYAARMRAFQIEAYRREVPEGGYVVSVIRDFPLAAMGLLDYRDQPKWIEPQLARSQNDLQLLLSTPSNRFAFAPGSGLPAEAVIQISHYGRSPILGARLEINAPVPATGTGLSETGIELLPGRLEREAAKLVLDQAAPVESPRKAVVVARLRQGDTQTSLAEHAWPIWLVPAPEAHKVRLHESVGPELAGLFSEGTELGENPSVDGPPIVATRFDDTLLGLLETGAKVMMLPDGEPGSFLTANHWFLRGGPYLPAHPIQPRVPREFFVDLQHFDLSGPVIPRIDAYLDQIDPILLLWDNHDLKEVRTHGLVFETRVGNGRLLVSALGHGPRENAAGRWLLGELLSHLREGPAPRQGLTQETRDRLREKIQGRSIDLGQRAWRFRPDPENRGLEMGWHRPEIPTEAGWTDIRIDRHWESQGYETLDGWAWYRLDAEIPGNWMGQEIYASFRGVDDAYEVYVNGEFVGSGGDIEARQTAFEERVSHRVTDLVKPGDRLTLAVRVFDWYGAGGLFRPVSLGTARIGSESDWIR